MNLSDLIKKRLEAAMKELTSSQFKKEVGERVKDGIVDRTRQGKAAQSEGARPKKLEPLTEGYKKYRKSLRKRGILSSKTQPARSNLTKTGEMLDSVQSKVSGEKITIQVTGDENIRKANENAKMGRPFMNISDLDIKEIRDLISTVVSKYLK